MERGFPNSVAGDVVRLLVVGDAGVGKSTLVRSLCGDAAAAGDRRTVGCRVDARIHADGLMEEFYDVCGGERFERGRALFYRAAAFHAVLFVHDLSDAATRASLSRVWVPEVMAVLGDVKAIDAGGRPESAGPHVRSRGVLSELRVLWMHLRSKHAGLSSVDAFREALKLLCRFFVLLANEYGLWTRDEIDLAAERELLSRSTVPVALVGLKRDLASSTEWRPDPMDDTAKTVSAFSMVAFDSRDDAALRAFLRRAAQHARRRGGPSALAKNSPSPHVAVALPL